jgi:GT2 family glycosyltransferase
MTDDSDGLKDGLSIVIVAFRTGPLLLDCLQSVLSQSCPDTEIIVVDNGGNEGIRSQLAELPIRYLNSGGNVGACRGRNAGLAVVSKKLVLFLEDDAIADSNLVSACCEAFEDPRLVAFRGRAKPRTQTVYNFFAEHYDLGEEAFPFFLNLEGVTAFRTEAIRTAGGWNAKTPYGMGHEGMELSRRLLRHYGRSCIQYQPGAIIHHDYCGNLLRLIRKDLRKASNRSYLNKHFPFEKFLSSYPLPASAVMAARAEPDEPIQRLKLTAIRRMATFAPRKQIAWLLRRILPVGPAG